MKIGRPSKYTPALVEEVCARLSTGETLRSICRDEHMPADDTIRDWGKADASVSACIAAARARGYDAIADECISIADDARNDYMQRESGVQLDAEHVQRSKLRIETRLKLLAKWDPKRYGEKLALGGADDLPPIKTMPDEALMLRIKALQDKLGAAEK